MVRLTVIKDRKIDGSCEVIDSGEFADDVTACNYARENHPRREYMLSINVQPMAVGQKLNIASL